MWVVVVVDRTSGAEGEGWETGEGEKKEDSDPTPSWSKGAEEDEEGGWWAWWWDDAEEEEDADAASAFADPPACGWGIVSDDGEDEEEVGILSVVDDVAASGNNSTNAFVEASNTGSQTAASYVGYA